MDIRSVGASELDALLALYEHLHPEDQPLPARDQIEAVWQAIIANPAHHCFGLYREAQLVMEMIADTGRMASLDIVEVSPTLDIRNATAELAVEMVESLFGKSTLMRD